MESTDQRRRSFKHNQAGSSVIRAAGFNSPFKADLEIYFKNSLVLRFPIFFPPPGLKSPFPLPPSLWNASCLVLVSGLSLTDNCVSWGADGAEELAGRWLRGSEGDVRRFLSRVNEEAGNHPGPE